MWPGEYVFTVEASGYLPRKGALAVAAISGEDHHTDLKITRKSTIFDFLKKFRFALALCAISVIAFVLNRSYYKREKEGRVG